MVGATIFPTVALVVASGGKIFATVMNEWVPIFKTGEHVSANGFRKTWTESDLDRIVQVYNEQPADNRHDAPAVIGHPKTDGPAYGFFSELKREGNILQGKLRDATDEFKGWVKQGHYRKVSPKIDSSFLLKHVGWLGAQAPAIKGLPEFNFNQPVLGEDWECSFSEPDDDNSSNREGAMKDGKPDPNKKEAASEETQTPVPVGVSEQEFSEYKRAQEEEQKRLQSELDKQRDRNQEMEFSAWLGREDLKGKVTPAMKGPALRLMKTLANTITEYEFSELDSEGKQVTVKRSPLDEFKGLLERLPDSVMFEEFAQNGRTREEEFSEASDKELDSIIGRAAGGGI